MIRNLICFCLIFSAAISFAQTDSTRLVVKDTSVVKDNHTDTASAAFNIPIFSTSGGDVDADLEQQDVSSLLSSSRDVFTSFSFNFLAGRYRMRGYLAENMMVMINGVNVNNLETGFSTWSSWGGLNDVTRFTENRFGNVANRYGFSGAGGYTNIDSKASSFRAGTRISYAAANRVFGNRVTLTHSTGLMQNGWAFTISASSRWGNETYIPGTYFRAASVYAAIDKRLDDKHTLSFTGFGAPIEQGRNSNATLEAYELAGTHYYNSNWGYQDGKVRNGNVSKVNRPMLMLSHIFNVNSDSKLTSSLFYNFGKSKLGGLTWFDSPNPRPDYYRYLPSYNYAIGDTAAGDILKNNWLNDVNTRQINWDRLIAMNRANLFTLPSQTGQINTGETRSRYIVESRLEDLKNIGFNSVYNTRIDNFFISGGVNANIYKNRKYKEVDDLLGGTFWLDYDQFADNLGVDPIYAANNLDEPDKKIFQGDKFGYDYSINMNRAELWGQGEYNLQSFDMYVGISVSNSSLWREGFMANGKFPTTSKGESEKLNFFNYGVKGGVTYKVNGRHFITANATYLTRNPEANNVFLSPRVRNDIVDGVTSEKVLSGDINYLIKYPTFKLRATAYHTNIKDQLWMRTYWSDLYNNNVNYIMTGVAQTHNGVELGIEKTLLRTHVLQGAFGYGQFLYSNRPTAQSWQDNNNQQLFSGRTVYLENYKVGGSPQLVTGLGYRYNGKKFWSAGLNFNYFDQIYVDPNPDRRTAEAVSKHVDTETQEYHEIIDQERLDSYYTVNLTGYKSFRIAKKYFLNINLSINNLLNNTNIITGGVEQLRWDQSRVSKFPNRYWYMQGLTYMATVNFNF
ncbi:MAG: TonB-dependent receptor [Bacteroidetes bacterium]|jgi:hypothetical protein|nr:TonB-dependent receptor [Bacteroidota bacterium]